MYVWSVCNVAFYIYIYILIYSFESHTGIYRTPTHNTAASWWVVYRRQALRQLPPEPSRGSGVWCCAERSGSGGWGGAVAQVRSERGVSFRSRDSIHVVGFLLVFPWVSEKETAI